MTTAWTPAHVAAIAATPLPAAPVITTAQARPLLPGVDLWDHWPVIRPDGRTAEVAGGRLVMLLSAPHAAHPDERHANARIRLMHVAQDAWRDLGPVLPETLSPGSREWAGSAVLDGDVVTLFFTAAGRRGEAEATFEQRLFQARARLRVEGDHVALGDWSAPAEIVAADGVIYTRDMAGGGALGTIKAFRDPAWFRDPADGSAHLTFAASLAGSTSPWNGAVGHAVGGPDGRWALRPPLVTADRLNNELERPHLVAHGGLTYLFWSTQRHVFAAGGPSGPTGLYGMVADTLAGPWGPLNGTGLVIANPPEAPLQAFSWLVTAELDVLSFVDVVGHATRPADIAQARAAFGGTLAPILRLRLNGDSASLDGTSIPTL